MNQDWHCRRCDGLNAPEWESCQFCGMRDQIKVVHVLRLGKPIMRALRDLPNIEGYRFTGIDRDGREHACIVVKDAVGCHTVKRIADMEPFFFRLHSWCPSLSGDASYGGSDSQ